MIKYKAVLAITASVIVLYVLAKRQAAAALSAINPVSPHNVIAQSADAVVASLSGGAEKTTGGAWFDYCHARDFKPWFCPTPKG